MPDWAPHVRARLASLRLSPTRETEIVDELSQHLEDRYRELIAGGISPDEATRLALADFQGGNILGQKMASLRQAHVTAPTTLGAPTGHVVSDLWQEVRYAATYLLEAARLRCDGSADPRSWDRRGDRDLQRRLWRAVEAASLPRAGQAGESQTTRAARGRNGSRPCHLSHLPREPTGVRGHRRMESRRGFDHGRR
jgi:hypothetical protein